MVDNPNSIDLICVGDNATDAFIRLSQAELHCDIDKPDCKICLKFASKIPYESVTTVSAGGNASNVAIGAAKLGLKTALISNVGDDERGEQTLQKLKASKVNTELVFIQNGKTTNFNYVLWYADDRTILVKHESFDYQIPEILETPGWLYVSSFGKNPEESKNLILNFLDKHPQTKLAFSPGTMQLLAGKETLKEIYGKTDILFCNLQEAGKITGLKDKPLNNIVSALQSLGIKESLITDGENGAYHFNGHDLAHTPIVPTEKPVFERTGAGDAFTSAYLAAIIEGQPPETALLWGAINSSSVVMKIGPHEGLLDKTQIEAKTASITDFVIDKNPNEISSLVEPLI